jgi:hypothetical protein
VLKYSESLSIIHWQKVWKVASIDKNLSKHETENRVKKSVKSSLKLKKREKLPPLLI